MSVDSLIANAQAYANEASGSASFATQALVSLADRVSSLGYALGTTVWEHAKVSDEAKELMADIRYIAMPDVPDGIGEFSDIDELEDYEAKDYSDLKNKLKQVVKELARLPDRFLQAAVLFDLVDSTARSRINSALEVTAAEVNYAFDIHVQEEVDKLDDSLDDITEKYAALGHIYAPGKVLWDMQRSAKENARVLSSYNRDITGKYALEAQDNTEAYGSLAVKSAAAQMGIGQEKYDAIVQAARVLVNAAKAEAQDKDLEFKMYELNFKKEAVIQELKTSIFRSTVGGWAAKFEALSRSYAVTQQAEADKMLSVDSGDLKALEEAKIKLDAFSLDQELAIQQILEKITILSQKVTGALASLNTLVGQITTLTED